MKRITVILGITLALSAVGDAGVWVQLVFKKAPVEQVVKLYSDLTGNKVEVEAGVYATISLRTENDVTKGEAVRLVEEALREQNVGLFPKAPNICVARWIDPAVRPQGTPSGLSPSISRVSSTTNGNKILSHKARRAARDQYQRAHLAARAARTNGSGAGNTAGFAGTNATECVLENGDAKPMTEEGPNKEPNASP